MNHLTNFEIVLVIASAIYYACVLIKFAKLMVNNYEDKK